MEVDDMEVDDIIEQMDGESSDEDHPLSDDSGCISDGSEDFTEINQKIVDNSQIDALSGRTKQCAISFYYITTEDIIILRARHV